MAGGAAAGAGFRRTPGVALAGAAVCAGRPAARLPADDAQRRGAGRYVRVSGGRAAVGPRPSHRLPAVFAAGQAVYAYPAKHGGVAAEFRCDGLWTGSGLPAVWVGLPAAGAGRGGGDNGRYPRPHPHLLEPIHRSRSLHPPRSDCGGRAVCDAGDWRLAIGDRRQRERLPHPHTRSPALPLSPTPLLPPRPGPDQSPDHRLPPPRRRPDTLVRRLFPPQISNRQSPIPPPPRPGLCPAAAVVRLFAAAVDGR